jgi:hypothetical protein
MRAEDKTMTTKTNPMIFARDYVKSLGGDAAFEAGGEWYLGERDPETETVMPVLADDNSGDYVALTPHIRQAVFMENDAADEPHDEDYADQVVAALKDL